MTSQSRCKSNVTLQLYDRDVYSVNHRGRDPDISSNIDGHVTYSTRRICPSEMDGVVDADELQAKHYEPFRGVHHRQYPDCPSPPTASYCPSVSPCMTPASLRYPSSQFPADFTYSCKKLPMTTPLSAPGIVPPPSAPGSSTYADFYSAAKRVVLLDGDPLSHHAMVHPNEDCLDGGVGGQWMNYADGPLSAAGPCQVHVMVPELHHRLPSNGVRFNGADNDGPPTVGKTQPHAQRTPSKATTQTDVGLDGVLIAPSASTSRTVAAADVGGNGRPDVVTTPGDETH